MIMNLAKIAFIAFGMLSIYSAAFIFYDCAAKAGQKKRFGVALLVALFYLALGIFGRTNGLMLENF